MPQTQPIGYYGCSDHPFFGRFQEIYGSCLQELPELHRLILRSTVAQFQVCQNFWDGDLRDCAETCLVGAGADDFGLWEEEPGLIEICIDACLLLNQAQREALILALCY